MNRTNHTTEPSITLGILSGFISVSSVLALFANGLIVVTYVRTRSVRTTFTIYILSLSVFEMLLALPAMPAYCIQGFSGYWPLGNGMCGLYLYCADVFGSAVRYGHVLIAVNRAWAVSFPVSYRLHHTMRSAKVAILAKWILANLPHLPVIILSRVWLVPGERNCVENVVFLQAGAVAKEFAGFTASELLLLAASVVTLCGLKKRRKTLLDLRRRARKNKFGTSSNDKVTATISRAIAIESREPAVTSSGDPARRVSPGDDDGEYFTKRNRGPYNLLGNLVIAVILCWTPNHVYWLMVDFGYWSNTFFLVQGLAMYSDSWINPVLCYMALRQSRTSVGRFIKCKH